MRLLNDLLALLLELLVLVALGYWGFTTGDGIVMKVLLGVGAPVLAAFVWWLFAAPRARFRVPLAGVLLVKALVFGAATLALLGAGLTGWAIAFAIVVVVNTVAVTILRAKHSRAAQTLGSEPARRRS